jgi:putative oxidoreductase
MKTLNLKKLRQILPKHDYFFLLLTKTRPMWGIVPVRIAMGAILINHGFNHFTQAMGGIHLISALPEHPITSFMIFVFSVTEMAGGLLLVLGLLSRVVGAGMAIELLIFTAIERMPIGFDAGYEMRVLLIMLSLMFAMSGSGLFSLDRVVARHLLSKHPNVKHQAYIIAETPYRERWYE